MNIVQYEDIYHFVSDFEIVETLSGSKFLVTGATGLIGSTLVHCLLALNNGIEITCPIRDIKKAQKLFGYETTKIHFVECDLLSYLNSLTEQDHFQYIIHCASPTSGKYIIEHPVETYELAFNTTRVLLNHVHRTNVSGMVYVSSVEYYGQMFDDRFVTEDMQGFVDYTDSRSSYSLGKRAAEYLCTSYAKEYGINVKIARPTQTFGAGILKDDNRVFAQFTRSIINNADIVLHTTGESAKPYCYTTDCISAILYILLKGKNGEAYNVANEDTYISIKEMAMFLCNNFNPKINVRVELHPEMGYAPITKLHLSVEKLKSLGWSPQYSLKEMYNRLIEYLKLMNYE